MKVQGKDFILYNGLLELARGRGLKLITTDVIQVPSKENGFYAAAKAEVQTDDGIFSGIGDASPDNVNITIRPHLLRMAETRAKARALRDAVGVDMVAYEELAGNVEAETTSKPAAKPSSKVAPKPTSEAEDPADIVVTFGKYALKTLGEILEIDNSYVVWLAANAKDENLRSAANVLIGA